MAIRHLLTAFGWAAALHSSLWAQPLITDPRESGSWIFRGANDGRVSHFASSEPSFPKTISYTSSGGQRKAWMPGPEQARVLDTVLGTFKALMPQPPYHSITYGALEMQPAPGADRRASFTLHMGEALFVYGKDGKVEPINPGLQFARMYDGFANVHINGFPIVSDVGLEADGPIGRGIQNAFLVSPYLSLTPRRLGMGGDVRPTGRIYSIPPQDNFVAIARSQKEAIPEDLRLTRLPTERLRWQHISTGRNDQIKGSQAERTHYQVSNLVILSAGNALPFQLVSIGQLLEVLATIKDEDIAFVKMQHEATVKAGSPDYQANKKHVDKTYEDNLQARQSERTVVDAMKAHYASRLGQPAVVHPDQHFALTGTLWVYADAAKKSGSFRNLGDVFIDNAKDGVSLVSYLPGFYSNLRPGEVKSIIIEWDEVFRPPKNLEHGKLKPAGTPTRESDVPGTLRHGMRHLIDWSRLTALLKE